MLLGRDAELERLRALLERAEPVVVVGEAGVGKTTLLREAACRSGRPLLEGGGFATLQWLPYLPFSRALGRELRSEGDPAYVAEKVEQAVGEALLFVDDLHWADEASRALIPFLVRRVALATAVRRGEPATPSLVDELVSLHFRVIAVEPLGADAAAALAAELRPRLDDAARRAVVERSGGNPLLIEELSASGEPPASLQLALAARLRLLSPAARRAMGLLSLAGRPLERGLVESAVDELREAGLVALPGGFVAVRHALLAEVAAQALDAGRRRELHAELARVVGDPGEAARHHAEAGERKAAFEKAMEAVARAETPGERAVHLALAATCAEGPEADALRLRAASALSDGHRHGDAEALLGLLRSRTPAVRAEACLIRARARWAQDAGDDAEAECRAGLELLGDSRELELKLRLLAARIEAERALVFERDLAEARARAEAALDLSKGLPAYEADGFRLVATAKLAARQPGWREDFERALAAAREAGEPGKELEIARNFSYALMIDGRLDDLAPLCDEMVALARSLRLLGWERRFRNTVAGVHWHRGEPRAAVDVAAELSSEVTAGDAFDPGFYLAQALTDLGRHDEALAHTNRLIESAPSGWYGQGEALWGHADALYWSGRLQEAVDAAEQALARFGSEGPRAFVEVTLRWARFELGLDPGSERIEAGQPIVEGAPPELEALAALYAADADAAALLFREAAALWRARHVRGELRCLWAEGEALRRAGKRDAAQAALERLEARCASAGYAALLARIRRSLRLAGVRRSAERTRRGELTGREHEVLALVADGLTNAEIARRLGLGRPTVERLVASASRKLGAASRAQAAALAARR